MTSLEELEQTLISTTEFDERLRSIAGLALPKVGDTDVRVNVVTVGIADDQGDREIRRYGMQSAPGGHDADGALYTDQAHDLGSRIGRLGERIAAAYFLLEIDPRLVRASSGADHARLSQRCNDVPADFKNLPVTATDATAIIIGGTLDGRANRCTLQFFRDEQGVVVARGLQTYDSCSNNNDSGGKPDSEAGYVDLFGVFWMAYIGALGDFAAQRTIM